MGINIEIMG